jgi:glutamate--cysteine ligase
LAAARTSLHEPATLPSARVLAAMADGFDNSFVAFARSRSEEVKKEILVMPFDAALQQRFEALSAQSVQEQKKIEAADTLPFEQYRQQYLSAQRLVARTQEPAHA